MAADSPNSGEGPRTLGDALGITDYELEAEDLARARLPLSGAVLQPYGIVHGGAYACLAESVASRATYDAVGPDNGAFGQSNDTTFLRPISAGSINAVARARHRGRTTWVWDVEMSDDEGRVCALSRMTVAVRPLNRES